MTDTYGTQGTQPGAGTDAADAALTRLLAVQDLDTGIARLRHRRETLPERAELASVDARLAELDGVLSAGEDRAGEVAARLAELDAQVAALSARRSTIEDRMYSSRGAAPRDLQAMDDEISQLSRHRAEIEDQEIALMEDQEALEADLASSRASRADLGTTADALRAAVWAAESALDAEIASQEMARAAQAAGLPHDLVARYEALRAHLKGTGAARLVGGRCDGCHLQLPSMEVERIRRLPPGEVVTCEQCGRILVRVAG